MLNLVVPIVYVSVTLDCGGGSNVNTCSYIAK